MLRRPADASMSLSRHAKHYLLIGIVQWLLDWGVMVGLSHLGLRIGYANIAGRVAGALLGFWANGKITFASADTRVGRRQLLRFIAMWVVLTLVSTWAIEHIDDVLGRKWAWLAKPLVQIALGMVGFLGSRHWVYKA